MNKFNRSYVNSNKPIAIIGEAHSGKSNLAIYLISLIDQNKKRYVLGYPKALNGFTSLGSIDDLPKISSCILFVDEFSKYFPVWEKRSNEKLMELLQFAEHNNIKVVLTTQLSQFITKQCEAFIPTWAIKQVNMRRLKNGSTPSFVLKYVIKDKRITSDYMKMQVNEFVWYNEQGLAGESKVYNFPDMKLGKDWQNSERITEKNVRNNLKKTPTKIIGGKNTNYKNNLSTPKVENDDAKTTNLHGR